MYPTPDQTHFSGGRSHRIMVASLGVRYLKLCETVSRRDEMGRERLIWGVRSELLVLGGKNFYFCTNLGFLSLVTTLQRFTNLTETLSLLLN